MNLYIKLHFCDFEKLSNKVENLSTNKVDNSTFEDYKISIQTELANKVNSDDLGYKYDASKNAFVAGKNSIANGNNTFAEGLNTVSSGSQSHAEGTETKATGNHSHAEGYRSEASAVYAHAEGNETTANATSSHTEGYHSHAGGDYTENTLIAGTSTTAGAYAHAEGNATIAAGIGSHSEGKKTLASGAQSHAEGNITQATGNQSHAEGYECVASGTSSHAEGSSTKASSTGSHSEGRNTVASGNAAHAEGNYTIASGIHSHAEGYQTEAQGNFSHAEGSSTQAIGYQSHAEGLWNVAKNAAQHVSGKYATIDETGTVIFQVGIGTSENERKDAIRIDSDGNITILDKNGEEVILQDEIISTISTNDLNKLFNLGLNIGVYKIVFIAKGVQYYLLFVQKSSNGTISYALLSPASSAVAISNEDGTLGWQFYNFEDNFLAIEELQENVTSIRESLSTKVELGHVDSIGNLAIDNENKIAAIQSDFAFERGEMAEGDCIGLYMESMTSDNTMSLAYNLMGDYCTIQVTDLHLPSEWWYHIFYRLPVVPIATAQIVAQSSANELLRIDTMPLFEDANKGYGYPVLSISHAGEPQGVQQGTLSFTLTYKYK